MNVVCCCCCQFVYWCLCVVRDVGGRGETQKRIGKLREHIFVGDDPSRVDCCTVCNGDDADGRVSDTWRVNIRKRAQNLSHARHHRHA